MRNRPDPFLSSLVAVTLLLVLLAACGPTAPATGPVASVPPWNDHDIHLHTDSEEYYFVFQGELHVLVDGATMTLKPHEVLMIKPGVPHAVVGGMGPIEHFVLRMLAAEDRRAVGRIPAGHATIVGESERELRAEWGCRVPLTGARYQNCWLFGAGQAHFHSDVMCLAYLDFPSAESLGTDRHSHRLHLLMEGVQCNCGWGVALDMTPNLTSHHLRVLREAGLVDVDGIQSTPGGSTTLCILRRWQR